MWKKLFNWIVVLFPILSAYGLDPSHDFGTFIVFGTGVLCMAANAGKLRYALPKGYMLFFIFAVVFSVFFAKSLPLRLALFTLNMYLACNFCEWDLIKTYYQKVVLWSCAFFLVQYAMAVAMGSYVLGIVPFVPTIYGQEGGSMMMDISIIARPSSFFLEPSYFAQFLFPAVALKLYTGEKRDIKEAIFVSVILVLCGSGNGALLLILLWGIWLLYSNISRARKSGIIVLGVAGIGALAAVNPEILEMFISRTGELQSYAGNEQYQSSGFIRFFRGYYPFFEQDSFRMFVGNNPDIVEDMLSRNIFLYNLDSDRFINGVQTLLLHNGILVTLLYLRHIILFIKGNRKHLELFAIGLGFLLMMFAESYYLCSRAFLATIMMYLMYNEIQTKNNIG